jgi:hypothetical protein
MRDQVEFARANPQDSDDLAKLIAVAEKAQKLRPLFNLMADEEIELDDALSELDKT